MMQTQDLDSKHANSQNLTQGSITNHLLRLAFPMLLAFAANLSYDLAETFFISKLGNNAMIALGFVNPVIFFILNMGVGFHVGVNSVASRLIGHKKSVQAADLSTLALIVSILTGLCISILGTLTTRSLFSRLGASGEPLQLVVNFMQYVYPAVGVRFAVLTLVGIFLANGFMLFSGLIIVLASLINIVIAYLFIFGWKSFPALNIEGAGLVNLLSNVAIFFILLISASRRKIINGAILTVRLDTKAFGSLRNVAKIAIPSAVANATNPLAQTIINSFLSKLNTAYVAGFEMGYKIHFFSLMPILALSSVVGPVVGQNLGGGRPDRVREAIIKAMKWSLFFSFFIFIFFHFAARASLGVFLSHADTAQFALAYLKIVTPTLFGFAITMILCAAHDAAGHPFRALGLVVFRSLGILVVFTYLGLHFWGGKSLHWSMAIANITSLGMSVWSFRKHFK